MPSTRSLFFVSLCVYLTALVREYTWSLTDGLAREKTTKYNDILSQPLAGRILSTEEARSTNAAASTQPISRILLSIFTTDSQKDFARRNMIRKTYLSMYKTFEGYGLDEGQYDRICALSDLMQDASNPRMEQCRVVYTFVMGGIDASNTTAPTDLLENDDSTVPYVLPPTDSTLEQDVLRLNIRENMNEGKTTTWFKYASTMLPENLGITLIAKVDTDTVVFPRTLLEEVEMLAMASSHDKVYAGVEEVARSGEVPYMQGGFYILSRSLAQEITSDTCPRSLIVQRTTTDRGFERAEDRELGNLVEECGRGKLGDHVQTLFLARNSAGHQRRYKDANGFRVKWKEGLADEIATLRLKALRTKYNNKEGCPPTAQALAEDLSWFEEHDKLARAKGRFSKKMETSCSDVFELYSKLQ